VGKYRNCLALVGVYTLIKGLMMNDNDCGVSEDDGLCCGVMEDATMFHPTNFSKLLRPETWPAGANYVFQNKDGSLLFTEHRDYVSRDDYYWLAGAQRYMCEKFVEDVSEIACASKSLVSMRSTSATRTYYMT